MTPESNATGPFHEMAQGPAGMTHSPGSMPVILPYVDARSTLPPIAFSLHHPRHYVAH